MWNMQTAIATPGTHYQSNMDFFDKWFQAINYFFVHVVFVRAVFLVVPRRERVLFKRIGCTFTNQDDLTVFIVR